MKFVDDKNNEIQFENSFTKIKENESIIRKISDANGSAVFSCVDNSGNTVSSDELFQLKINVKGVSSFLFVFRLNKFNRERIVDQIFLLRKRKVTDKESARIKVDKLADIVFEHNPLFVVCYDFGEFALDIEMIKEIFKNFVVFYVEEGSKETKPAEERAVIEEKVNEIEESPVEEKTTTPVKEKAEEVKEEEPSEEDHKPSNFKDWIKKCWSSTSKFLKECGLIIKKDYFNFIFAYKIFVNISHNYSFLFPYKLMNPNWLLITPLLIRATGRAIRVEKSSYWI